MFVCKTIHFLHNFMPDYFTTDKHTFLQFYKNNKNWDNFFSQQYFISLSNLFLQLFVSN